MNYIFDYNGEEITLPKYSFAIQEDINKADKINMSENYDYKKKCRTLYDFESRLIGEEKLKEILEGEFDQSDPNEIQILFILICRCYDNPIENVNNEESEDTLQQIGQIKDFAEQMNKVPETMGKVQKLKK